MHCATLALNGRCACDSSTVDRHLSSRIDLDVPYYAYDLPLQALGPYRVRARFSPAALAAAAQAASRGTVSSALGAEVDVTRGVPTGDDGESSDGDDDGGREDDTYDTLESDGEGGIVTGQNVTVESMARAAHRTARRRRDASALPGFARFGDVRVLLQLYKVRVPSFMLQPRDL